MNKEKLENLFDKKKPGESKKPSVGRKFAPNLSKALGADSTASKKASESSSASTSTAASTSANSESGKKGKLGFLDLLLRKEDERKRRAEQIAARSAGRGGKNNNNGAFAKKGAFNPASGGGSGGSTGTGPFAMGPSMEGFLKSRARMRMGLGGGGGGSGGMRRSMALDMHDGSDPNERIVMMEKALLQASLEEDVPSVVKSTSKAAAKDKKKKNKVRSKSESAPSSPMAVDGSVSPALIDMDIDSETPVMKQKREEESVSGDSEESDDDDEDAYVCESVSERLTSYFESAINLKTEGQDASANASPPALLFFQMPPKLPFVPVSNSVPETVKEKEKEPEPSVKSKGKERAPEFGPLNDAEVVVKKEPEALPEEEITTPVESRSDEGYIGSLVIRQSGKVELRIATSSGTEAFIPLDVALGAEASFFQALVALDKEEKQAFVLGAIADRFIVSPNLDHLLSSTSQV